MGLFDKKTAAEKERRDEIRDIKKQARQDERDTRKDAREDKKEIRQEARDDKQEARQDARDDKQEARQDKRDAMKEIRQSDLEGKDKREAKSDARGEKRDAVDDARTDKRDTIDDVRDAQKRAIDAVQEEKRDRIGDITTDALEAMASLNAPATSSLDAALALELLALTHAAQFQDAADLNADPVVGSGMYDEWTQCRVRGALVRNATAISGRTFKSDTECFVARSDDGDLVVVFRGSEIHFFDHEGAFKDWVLTDFRSNRIAYPPAPKSWPDQRWVHAGFWQAYSQIRNVLLAEVTRQAMKHSPARRIYVTGFSLGGALALLAALDIAEGLRDIPVELFTFAAPRVGDASLNTLLAERVSKSTLVAFRGDPVVHLPPFGPNFPVTLKHPIGLDLAGIHIGLGKPLPQVNQQYRTAATLIYIDADAQVHDRFPMAQVALNFRDHDWPPYCSALTRISTAQAV